MKNSCSFHISAQNIDYGYSLGQRGIFNAYPQYMFLSRNKKFIYTSKSQFYCKKLGYKEVKLYRRVFCDVNLENVFDCAPLVADLFLFFYERDFMKSLSRESQADIIEAFNSTSRYLDDLLNIGNIYFDQMVDRIYPTEL